MNRNSSGLSSESASEFRDGAAADSAALLQQLRERDALLAMAEHAAGIGIWDIDLATDTVRGTPQFWRVMGLPPIEDAVPVETTRALRLPEDRERVADSFQSVLGNHAESFETEYRIRRPDGEIRWIFGRGRLIRDKAGRPIRYSGIDIDVTERKTAEAALGDMNQRLEQRVRERTAALAAEITRRAEAEAQLHQAQKMDTIGQLTGGVAHDFNNLLTVISGNIEALERFLPNDPRLRRFVETALRGIDRAATLSHRLLAFARRQPLEPKLIDVNQLILGMSELLHRTLGDTISIRMRLADDLVAIFTDPNQLENAILNLAINARDAMIDGGILTFETGERVLAESDVENGTPAIGRCVAIAIRDSGPGMPPEVRERAFEPFFTTKQSGQGTGLGLPQVYGFVKQAGGHCALQSEPGQGTAVLLYLPAADSVPQPAIAEHRPPALARGAGELVLVTEDHPEVRAYCVDLLRELGYEVMAAGDAATALRILEANRAVRLVFADIGLPGPVDGRLLAESVLFRFPEIRVLLTTGNSNAIPPHDPLDPAIELIAKPYSASALAAAVRRALDKPAGAEGVTG